MADQLAAAEREPEVDAVARGVQGAACQLLDAPDPVAQRMAMTVQLACGALPLAVALDERLQRAHQLAAVGALALLDRGEDRVAEQPQRLVVLQREQQLEGAEVAVGGERGVPVAVAVGGQRACLQSAAGLVEAAAQVGGRDGTPGAGRMVPPGELRRAFHEARCALEARGLAVNGGATAGLATYRDLGSFQLLLSLQDDEALRLFCDSILAPIEDGEGAYGGELMRSLEAFIECNGQWERAARRLYCHRHTLRYRIRKVEELTGRDLASARDRIEFWLALRGRELVP